MSSKQSFEPGAYDSSPLGYDRILLAAKVAGLFAEGRVKFKSPSPRSRCYEVQSNVQCEL